MGRPGRHRLHYDGLAVRAELAHDYPGNDPGEFPGSRDTGARARKFLILHGLNGARRVLARPGDLLRRS